MKCTEGSLIACGLLFALAACQKPQEALVTPPKAGDTYELGTVLPELRTIENDTARVVLYPHARWFYLALIQAAAKSGRQVKARIFKRSINAKGEEIAQIHYNSAVC